MASSRRRDSLRYAMASRGKRYSADANTMLSTPALRRRLEPVSRGNARGVQRTATQCGGVLDANKASLNAKKAEGF